MNKLIEETLKQLKSKNYFTLNFKVIVAAVDEEKRLKIVYDERH